MKDRTKSIPPAVVFAYAVLAATVGFCGSPADDAWAARRAEALARPRTFVYNTDGNDAHNWPSNLPVTVENFTWRRLVHALGTRITTISYCPLSSGFGRLTCRKAGEAYCVKSHRGKRHVSADLFAMGTDPLELASQFCRTNGLEIFVSIRVNDTHDAAGSFAKPDPLFPDFKKNNPDCLMGRPEKGHRPPFCNWSAVDFSHEKVRAHMRAFVRDLVENYDLDGIEYDFNRHMQLFKSVALGGEASQAELDLMTAFMRELRAITEEVGRKKNHPILVVMRAPDSVDYCRAVGIDLARWFDERLVDIWIGGGYFCLNPWKVSADFAHRHGVKFYASMDETRIPRAAARRPVPPLKGRMTLPFYAARFADAMASGCDGVYVFNIEGSFLHQVAGIDPLRTKGRETIRFAADRGSGGYRPWRYLKDGGRFINLPKIDPGEPLRVKPGETCTFEMFVAGDSLAEATKATAKVLTNLKTGEKIAFACNGHPFEMAEFRPGVFVCPLPADALKAGANAFSVTFPQTAGKGTTFNDFALRIIPQSNQRRDAASPSRLLGVGDETVLCAGEEASLSADGRRLLFQRLVGGSYAVIMRDQTTGQETTISPAEGQTCHPAWGPDGSVLYTYGNETKTGFAARDDATGWNLWLWKDGERRQLTHGRQRAYAASFAPGGRTVYFSCDRVAETGKSASQAADLTGKAAFQAAADPNAISRAGIAAVPLDGHGAQRTVCVLPQSNSACSQPRVSPDGKFLLRAELAKFRETWRLVVSPLDHPEQRTYLTSLYEAAYAPAWSPDGKLIAYTGFRDGDAGWGVYVMPSEGVVTQRIADGRNPSFAPDGKSIIYDRDGKVYRREVTR